MKGNEKEQLSTMSRNRQDVKMNRQDTTTEEKNREEERKHKNSQKDQTGTGSQLKHKVDEVISHHVSMKQDGCCMCSMTLGLVGISG